MDVPSRRAFGARRALGAIAGLLGLAGTAVIVWGIAASMPGFPGYSPLRDFISMLAHPYNPVADRFNTGLIVGGSLAGLGLLAGALRVPRGPLPVPARAVGWWGAAAGLAFALVGWYPLTAEVPHLVFAGLAGICATVATHLAARSARLGAAAAGPTARTRARLAIATRIALVVQLGCIAVGLVYFVWLAAQIGPDSVEGLFRALPGRMSRRIAGAEVNPIAALEWIYFAAALAALVGKSVAELTTAWR